MYQLIYASQSVHYFAKPEINTLVNHANERNRALGITGILIYLDGEFIQLLEGEKDKVHFLMAMIEKDSRHHSINILKQHEIEKRQFKQWNMASQFMTKSLMSYILAEQISFPTKLTNLFLEREGLAENMMIKIRDRFLVDPKYSLKQYSH